MNRQEQIQRLLTGIGMIDEAVAQGRAQGYRICNMMNPGSQLAQFWGVDAGGSQRFGTYRNLMIMVVFPSERLAKRCLSMTGGYVVSVAHILAAQREAMEKQLRALQQLEKA